MSCTAGDEELNKIVRVNVSTSWIAYVHLLCALWAPEVFEDKHGNLVSTRLSVRSACMHASPYHDKSPEPVLASHSYHVKGIGAHKHPLFALAD